MPRASKKKGKNVTPKKIADNKNTTAVDVTINDFANSTSAAHVRLKKSLTLGTNELSHEDTDIGAGTRKVEENLKPKEIRSRRRSKLKDACVNENGIEYPLDLWFLISEYIVPEAVGKFARICKASCHVVRTAKFWFHMYKRFYTEDVELPEKLRPNCMVKVHGLRACVIRALHLMYFASWHEIRSNHYFQQEPHSLVKRRCCLMWHKKGLVRWYFFFKFKEISTNRSICKENDWRIASRHNNFELLDDVFSNPEDGCQILRVSCLKYRMVPLVMGLTLQSVRVMLSPGFDHHRIQLNFGTSYIPNTPTEVIVLNDVVDLKVLDWWHPCYPYHHHQLTVQAPLETGNESWDCISSDSSDYLTV